MKTNKNLILILLALIVVVSLSACGLFPEEDTNENTPVLVIDNSIVSATGVLVPEVSAYLSMAGVGRVDEVFVHEGEAVLKDQELIALGDIAQAEAVLAAAELEHEAAQQALDILNENADLVGAAARLALLDAKSAYIIAEDAWEDLDKDDLEDDIDDAQEDVVEAEEDLDEAQEKFDSYADLDEDSSLRQRYEDELEEAREDYNEKVRARDVLIIELESAEAVWQSALAAVDQAQADYDATLEGPDPDQLALAEARLTSASAQLEAASNQLENLTLSAPFAGVVADLMVSEGEWTSPGQPVAVLADLESLRVETTDLNEIDVVLIKLGDIAEVTFDAFPDEVFEGTVIEISPKASAGTGVNYTVVIELAEIPENARWGMTVFVDIDTKQ
jgi:multidrug efflux pump subunit AcrA (membrane-fusion protein)